MLEERSFLFLLVVWLDIGFTHVLCFYLRVDNCTFFKLKTLLEERIIILFLLVVLLDIGVSFFHQLRTHVVCFYPSINCTFFKTEIDAVHSSRSHRRHVATITTTVASYRPIRFDSTRFEPFLLPFSPFRSFTIIPTSLLVDAILLP